MDTASIEPQRLSHVRPWVEVAREFRAYICTYVTLQPADGDLMASMFISALSPLRREHALAVPLEEVLKSAPWGLPGYALREAAQSARQGCEILKGFLVHDLAFIALPSLAVGHGVHEVMPPPSAGVVRRRMPGSGHLASAACSGSIPCGTQCWAYEGNF